MNQNQKDLLIAIVIFETIALLIAAPGFFWVLLIAFGIWVAYWVWQSILWHKRPQPSEQEKEEARWWSEP